MSHERYQEWLAVYPDLTPREREEVDAHLASCAACAALLADYRALRRELEESPMPQPGARLGETFAAAVAWAQAEDRRGGLWPRLARAGLALGNAAAWAAVIAVTAVLVLSIAVTGPELARRAWPAAPTPAPASVQGAAALAGREWTLTALNGTPLVEGTRITLRFRDGMIGGSAGCNGYGAEYTATEEGGLTIGTAAVELRLCSGPDGVMEQERAYIDALGTVVSYRLDGTHLALRNAAGETILTYEESRPLATPAVVTAEPDVTVARLQRVQDLCCPPRFAPDGETYLTISEEGSLLLHSLSGGVAREVPLAASFAPRDGWRVSNATWTADGRGILVAQGPPSEIPHDVYLVDPASGAARRLGETYSPSRLVFDASGRLIVTTPDAFLALDLASGQSTQVPGIWPRLNAEQPELAFSPDGRYVATLEGQELSIVELATGARSHVTTQIHPRWGAGFAWSEDGRQLAYATGERGAAPELWVVGADGSGARRIATRESERDTGGAYAGLAWLPGTPYVVYEFVPWSNTATLQAEYQVVSAQGGPAKTLFTNGLALTLSPDGRVISFVRDLEGPDETGNWIAVLEYGEAGVPATATPAGETPIEPDLPSRRTLPTPTPHLGDLTPPPGGWIAYRTRDPDNRLALASPDGARRVVLDELGPVSGFSWSPDGRWLAVQRGERLSLISLEGPRIVDVTEGAWGLTPYSWSRDGRTLAYIHRHILGRTGASQYTVCLYDVATGQTVSTPVEPFKLAEWSEMAGQAAPPLAPVLHGLESTLQVWDVPAGQLVACLPYIDVGLSGYAEGQAALWLPDGRGLVFSRRETGQAPIEVPAPTPSTRTFSYYPSSLALWRPGEEAAQTVLETGPRRRCWPEGWLPDGRLEVRVMEWSQDRYESTDLPSPERVSYRYYRVGTGGQLEAVGAEGLPWWAGGRLQARLGWPLDPMGEFFRREVGPDGATVVFAGECPGQENSVCMYEWQGEGEPLALGPGYDPHWQPR